MEDALWRAIGKGDVSAVASVLDLGRNWANFKSKRGMTPLILATQCGELEIVSLLLERGALPNEATDIKSPISGKVDRQVVPIMFATSPGVVERLLAGGADLNARDADGRSVLHRVAGLFDSAVIRRVHSLGGRASKSELESLLGRAREELEFRRTNNLGPRDRLENLSKSIDVLVELLDQTRAVDH